MRKILVVLLVVFIGKFSFAQQTINSPYSSYGIGETNGLDHPSLLGIGNSTITMCDSLLLNFYNPSSYGNIAKGQPLFSLGVSTRLSNYSEGDSKSFGSASSVQHFAFGFSIAQRFGMAVGIKPYSRRGYNFTSGSFIDGDSLTYTYEGSGSINEAFIGLSGAILNFDSTKLSVGINAGYLFGYVDNTRKSQLFGLNSGGVGIKTMDVRSFHYDLGASFTHQFNDNHKVGLYASIDPFQNFKATYEEQVYFASDVNNANTYLDTSYYSYTTDSLLTNAPKFTYGLNYTYRFTNSDKKIHKLHPELSFHATYSTTDWSKYKNTFVSDTSALLNTSKITFGVQFVPETEFLLNTATTSFFSRVRYRAGFYSNTLPYSTNGEQVTDFGTTFGFGLPMSVGNSLSSINLGFSVGQRGVSDRNQLNENYYGISFGITIAPSESDKWFRKRKLN